MESRGLVIKVKEKTCLVLTPDGEYKEVPLPGGEKVEVGREIPLVKKRRLPFAGGFMVAASLLIFILAGLLYPGQPSQAVAYLTIDINPSIELEISPDQKVLAARGLNSDGEQVLAGMEMQNIYLREAVGLIINRAVAEHYLVEEGSNVILATLTFESGTAPVVDLEYVYEAIREPVVSSGVDADVIIEPVTPEIRRQALETGVSAGRYLLVQKSGKKGVPVSIGEVTAQSLGVLEKEKKVTLIEIMDEDRKIGVDRKEEKKVVSEEAKELPVIKDDSNDKSDREVKDIRNNDEKAKEPQEKKKGIYVSYKKSQNDKAAGKAPEKKSEEARELPRRSEKGGRK